jgi:MFS family permease
LSFFSFFSFSPDPSRGASLAAFLVVSSAMIGSVGAGVAADRLGRTTVCLCSLFVSIVVSLSIGWIPEDAPGWSLFVGVLWGMFAVAESAQYSAMTSEVVDDDAVGNAVTIQFGIGFLLTMPGMWIVPMVVESTGSWGWAWTTLTPGTMVRASN